MAWRLMKVNPVIAVCLSFATLPVCGETDFDEVWAKPAAEVEAELPSAHPATYYGYAMRLFKENRRDDAVFWFYAGQLRFRFHLSANPDLSPDGDPALMASLNDSAGATINEYAAGDPSRWSAQIKRVLEWDAETENGFTSKARFAKEWEEIRSGLMELGTWIAENADAIREEHAADRRAEEQEQRDPETDEEAQARTLRDIRSVGTIMTAWLIDQVHSGAAESPPYRPERAIDLNKYAAISREELERILVPRFAKSVPEHDGWGHPLQFYLNADPPWGAEVMAIRSPGRDGLFSASTYEPGSHSGDEFNQDLVWADGYLVRGPHEPSIDRAP